MKKTIISITTILGLSAAIADADYNEALAEEVYPVCSTCHNPDMAAAFGAPAAHNVEQWQATIEAAQALAQGDETVDDVFLNSVKNGKGIMVGIPAICEATLGRECTDEDYLAAIQYMMHDN